MPITYNIERNPLIIIDNEDGVVEYIQTIGDPHLGRTFKTNVLKDRLGEREMTVLSLFKELLTPKQHVKTVVCTGDLFDKFHVDSTVVFNTFNAIFEKCVEYPEVTYIFIPGNHDLSKNTQIKSSYYLLYECFSKINLPNLKFNLKDDFHLLAETNTLLYLDAYDPFLEGSKVLTVNKEYNNIISFGHWDSLDIISKGYTPSTQLLEMSDLLVSGHEHTYKEYTYPEDPTKTKVLFTGSMQPYSHSEDPINEIYITVDENDLDSFIKNTDTTNLCVRIYCSRDFVLPTSINCLALSYLIKEEQERELTELEVQVLEDSYTTKMSAFLSIQEKSEFSKQLLNDFKEKRY